MAHNNIEPFIRGGEATGAVMRKMALATVRQLALLTLSLGILMGSQAWAASYYISSTGSDTSGNGSQQTPWKSLSVACSKATKSGDVINMNHGNYVDNNTCNLAIGVNIQGAGMDLVKITSAYSGGMGTGYIYRKNPPQSPIIDGNNEISGFTLDGSNKTLTTGIFIRGTDELNIHNIRFQSIKTNAIWIEGYYDWADKFTTPPPAYGQNIRIHDIVTFDTSTEADLGWGARLGTISLGALEKAQVYNLTINENIAGRGTGVKAVPGWLKGFRGYNWTINTNPLNGDAFVFEMYNFLGDSEIYNSSFNHALSLNSGPQTLDPGSSWNLKIHDTTTDFSGFANGGLGHELSHNYLDFYNNFIYGNKGRAAGLWTTNYLTATSVNNWRFRNNVISNCATGGVTIERGDLSRIEIFNNVFDGISSSPWGGYGIDTEMFSGTLSNLNIRNNLFMNAAAGPIHINAKMTNTVIDHNWFFGNGNANTVKNLGSGTVMTTNSKGVSPGITWSGAKPVTYYLPASAGSNLVMAGINVGLPYTGSAPNIGAYELSSQQSTLLTAPTNLRIN